MWTRDKKNYEAKLIALWKATCLKIAYETRKIHKELSNVYSEAYAKAAEEYSKLVQLKADLRCEFERQVELREIVNSDI